MSLFFSFNFCPLHVAYFYGMGLNLVQLQKTKEGDIRKVKVEEVEVRKRIENGGWRGEGRAENARREQYQSLLHFGSCICFKRDNDCLQQNACLNMY